MDLNYLYHRRGVSLLRAGHAECEPSRLAHLSMARRYASRIANFTLVPATNGLVR